MNGITQWGIRHHVSAAAIAELRILLAAPLAPGATGDKLSEAAVQNNVRLAASKQGIVLMRNNVGVLKDENGRPVRYGLANDSPAMNRQMKSSDLIGLRAVTIRPEHVGSVIGQFVAYECKRTGWHYTGNEREAAQHRFIELVNGMGGAARFTTGEL